MSDGKEALKLRVQLLTVAEALRPCLPSIADLLDDAALTIEILVAELARAYSADR